MSRVVSADHVMFDECILAFRPNGAGDDLKRSKPRCSYLLTDFELTTEWHLPNFKVHPSKRIEFPMRAMAFISKIDNPEYWNGDGSHLFGIALSSIVSFVTGRACRSPRDGFGFDREQQQCELEQMALLHPIKTTGPGRTETGVSLDLQDQYRIALSEFVATLQAVEQKKYVAVMQAVRLVHLSLLTKREDFGLSYMLIVAAIESIAQYAISRDKVKIKHKNENDWARRAKNDSDFDEIFKAYKDARGKNEYLRERYVRFILTFVPISEWEKCVAIPSTQQDIIDFWIEVQNKGGPTFSGNLKSGNEKYPSDLDDAVIREALGSSYNYRSEFVHMGKQPPNKNSVAMERFFQSHYVFKEGYASEELLPTYDLLFKLAQLSICNWLKDQIKK